MLHNVWTLNSPPAAGGLPAWTAQYLAWQSGSLLRSKKTKAGGSRPAMSGDRRRTQSESSSHSESGPDLGMLGRCEVVTLKKGVSYDVDGKFSYSQV